MKLRKGQSKLWIGIPVFFVIFIIAIIVMFLGFDIVDANHLGVMVQLGTIKGIMENGIKYTGIFTHVEQYDLRTRKVVVDMQGDQSAVDKTGQAIFGTINVNFKIKADKETITQLYTRVGSDSVIADRLNIDAIIREGFKQATVKYEALEILDKRQEVKDLAIDNIRRNFPSEYFELQNVVVTNIDFSQEFKASIEAKKVAEQNALKEQNQLEVVKFQQQQSLEVIKIETEKLRLQKEQITPLLIQQQLIAKWNGEYPQYLIIPSDKMGTFLPLPNIEQK